MVRAAKKDPVEPRKLSVPDFKCHYCEKKHHHTEMDFRQPRACCRGCAPQDGRLEGLWIDKNGMHREPATLAA